MVTEFGEPGIHNVFFGKKGVSRNAVLSFLEKHKPKGFRVLDVGGVGSVKYNGNWAGELVDVILDRKKPHFRGIKSRVIVGDVETSDGWEEIEKEVEREGPFDFSICTHILEDLHRPSFVVSKLSEVSKMGFIATPSKFRDLLV